MEDDHDHRGEYSEEYFPTSSELPSFRKCIYEGEFHENIPFGFDAVTIPLDGRVQTDLNWENARQKALQAIEKGYAIMWDLDLGLFNRLFHPLTHQSQFLSLTLSLEHFRDSLWKELKSHSLGITLFRGSADFSQEFPWDPLQQQNFEVWLKEHCEFNQDTIAFEQLKNHPEMKQLLRLFCRDVAIEYLNLLAARLPDSLPCFIYLDALSLKGSSINEIQLLNPERYDRLSLSIKNFNLPFESYGWDFPTYFGYSGKISTKLPEISAISVGVCIPPMSFYRQYHYQNLERAFSALQQRSIPFKLLAESQLTSKWDGLDFLIYNPLGLSTQGKRKLQGFCAAGGTVVTVGDSIGLPNEILLNDWLANI